MAYFDSCPQTSQSDIHLYIFHYTYHMMNHRLHSDMSVNILDHMYL